MASGASSTPLLTLMHTGAPKLLYKEGALIALLVSFPLILAALESPQSPLCNLTSGRRSVPASTG